MAKMTKAQQVAANEAQSKADWEQFVEEYPARLLDVVYDFATTETFNVVRVTEAFECYTKNFRKYLPKEVFASSPEWTVMYTLEEAEYAVSDYVREMAKEQARAVKRSAALAKLTAEDRKLLNL